MIFSRKTLALITTFVIVLVALFVLSLSTTKQASAPTTTEPTPTPFAQTVIKLTPNPVTLQGTTAGSVEAHMETAGNEVIAVQLEIQYDPSILENVSIQPGSFFSSPVPLLNTIDKKDGRISYAVSIPPSQAPIRGTGTIATISFTKNPTATEAQTELKLLPRTIVVAKGIGPSVLSQALGTTVTLSTP